MSLATAMMGYTPGPQTAMTRITGPAGETEQSTDYDVPTWLYNSAGANTLGQAQAAGSTAGFGGYGGAMTQSLNTIGGKELYAARSPFQDMQGYTDNKNVYVRDPGNQGSWLSYDAMSPQAKAALQGKYSALNGTNYNMHDVNGNITGQKAFSGLKDQDHVNDVMMAVAGAALGGMAAFGGAGLGAAGSSGGLGAAGAGGVTGLPEAGLADLFYGGGADLLPGASGIAGSTLGGGGSFLGAGLGSTAAAALPAVASSGGGMSSIINQIGSKLGSTALSQILGGGGSGSGLNLAQLAGGLNDAYQQDQAGKKMLDWINGQQAKVDNLYSPGSPEYNYLWEQMSRQDAAAGRNSQYGPRSVDLAAKIAQIKADNTTRMTTGVSRGYSDALTQRANGRSMPGVMAALGQGNSGGLGGLDWSSLGRLFGGSGYTPGSGSDVIAQYGLPDNTYDIADWWS